jgi:hypothetical protein
MHFKVHFSRPAYYNNDKLYSPRFVLSILYLLFTLFFVTAAPTSCNHDGFLAGGTPNKSLQLLHLFGGGAP